MNENLYVLHTVGWLTLGSLFFSSFFLELPFACGVMGRMGRVGFVPALLLHLSLPAFLYYLPSLAANLGFDLGQAPHLGNDAVTITMMRSFEPFSRLFFVYCAAIGLFLALAKLFFLRFFGSDDIRPFQTPAFVLVSILATTWFIGGMTANERKVMTAIRSVVGSEMRVPASGPQLEPHRRKSHPSAQ